MPRVLDLRALRSRFPRASAALRRIAAALLVILVVAAGALAFLLHDLDGKVREALLAEGREMEAHLGRRMSVGPVHVALGLVTEIVVRDLVIEAPAGAAGDLAVPPLRVAEVRLGVALGPLIRSRGQAIQVTRFSIDGPEVTVVKTATGTSLDDVRARLSTLRKRRAPKVMVSLDRLAVRSGKIRIHREGEAADADLVAGGISLESRDLRAGAAARAAIGAAVFAPEKDLAVDLDLAPGPKGALAPSRVEVRATAIPIGPAIRWAQAKTGAIDLGDAVIDAALVVNVGAAIGVSGSVTIDKVRAGEGAPVAAALVADATIDPEAGTVAARSFELSTAGVTAHGSFAVNGAAAAIEAIDVEASGDAEAILARIPADRRPRGIALRGPAVLKLRGAGSADDARVTAALDVGDVRAVAGEAEGKPFAFHVEAEIAGSRSRGEVRVSRGIARLGDLELRGDVEARGIGSAPEIAALSASLSGPAEAIVDLAPPPRRPPGVTLRGPVKASLSAHGSRDDLRGDVSLDLDGALVAARGLVKPAGVPLNASVSGRVSGGRVEFSPGEVRIGALSVTARGSAGGGGDVDLAFETRAPADVASILRLAPGAAEKLSERASVDGKISASGKARRVGSKGAISIAAKLREARVRQGTAAIDGAVDASASIEVSGGKMRASLEVDLGGSTVDIAPAISKPAGQPLRASCSFTREGDHLSVSDASLTAPGVTVSGLVVDRDRDHLSVSLSSAAIALGPLTAVMPLVRGRLPPALADLKVGFGLALEAPGGDLAAAKLHLPGLSVRGGIGHVTGSLAADGLRPLRAVRLDLTGGDLDLSGLTGKGDGGAAELLGGDAGVRIDVRAHLDSVKARGQTATGVDAEIALEGGKISVARAHAAVLGGTVEVERSYADLSDVPEIELHARAKGIDLSSFASERVEALAGRASGSLDLHGRGLDGDAIKRSLRGTATLDLAGVTGKAHFVPRVKFVNKGLARLAEKNRGKEKKRRLDLAIRAAHAALDVAGGKVTTRAPITIAGADFTASLSGTIGGGPDLSLEGEVDLAPHVIADATKRALIPVRPVPLKLRLFEDAEGRKVEFLELSGTLLALRGALRNAVDNAAAPVP